MKLKLFDMFVFEGDPLECATFMSSWMAMMAKIAEHEKDVEAKAWLKKFGNLSFEELMKREQEEDGEE